MKNRLTLDSIRSRILALLGGLALLFIGGIWIFDWSNREFAGSVSESSRAERLSLLQEIISLKGASLRALIYDYTYSDEFIKAIKTGKSASIATEIGPSCIAAGVDRAWVLDKDGSVQFDWIDPSAAGLADIDKSVLRQDLKADLPFSHYFVTQGGAVMEVFGGSLHPTRDSARRGKSYGRLFVARTWTATYLDSLSKLCGAQASVRLGTTLSETLENNSSDSYRLSIPLRSADNTVLGAIEFLCSDPLAASLNSQSLYATISVVGFAALSIALLMIFLMKWVTRPLEAVSSTLRSSERTGLAPLLKDRSEIGDVANMVLMSLEIQDNFRFQGEVLEYRVKQRTSELAYTNRAMIEGWSRALDIRDHETEDHTKRVTAMAIRLGLELGLDDDELDRLYRGSMLHDIGKMGIPDSILQKPGQLTEREIGVMQTHPLLAAEMLGTIESVQDCIEIPVCHHEKWDGTGYPRGLSGTEIPWLARIFALADVWDAMRSDRPYRQGMPEHEVREFIESQSGIHFDPQVVDAYLKMEPMPHPRDAEPHIAKAA